ncbi:hypothetical protein [Pseudonocardia sp. KRD291]|nr:hypothetical protein [Pseudonocardia sp. KRD291]MBW0102636.1 hypothetical protein [Pseudonocardia sp. KRD291]
MTAIGAHTDAVLRALGRTDTEIAALRDRGVVRAPSDPPTVTPGVAHDDP